MKILTRTIGLLARMISGWHMLWASFHDDRAQVHKKRTAVHEARREARVEEASAIETAASSLAPPRQKAIAAPVEPAPTVEIQRKALAVAVENFHPKRAADDCQ